MTLHLTIAAVLAASAFGYTSVAASAACQEPCTRPIAVAQGKPLPLTGAPAAKQVSKRTSPRKVAKPAARARDAGVVKPGATSEPAPPVASADNAPLPAVVVRTTREPGNHAAPLARDISDGGRADVPVSLVVSTIAAYLGGPEFRDDVDAATAVNLQDFPADARAAFASEPSEQEPAQVALEYMLMTFGGALAAAAAIRVFVI